LIQEIQLLGINGYRDMIFEWIPYNQFNDVKEIGKEGVISHIAIWKDGPLCYRLCCLDHKDRYTRDQNKKVALKYLYNSQNITSKFLNEV
jgi:hypothetical protein